MKRKQNHNLTRKKIQEVKFFDGIPLEPTSSLNDYFMCVCGRRYSHKTSLIKHLEKCNGLNNPVVCPWCKLEFKNRGNLVTHAYHLHGDNSFKKPPEADKIKLEHKCDVCDVSFTERWKLKFHIRRHHFNLWARIPHAEKKRVNQVWFEKVLNTNLVVQIKKIGLNTLVMKRIPPNAGIKVHDNNRIIDLRSLYPTGHNKTDELCKICLKIFRKIDLQKHMNEKHFNLTKHKCNNCNQTFKRSYVYLQHVCHKVKYKGTKRKRKVAGVRQYLNSSNIRITAVESLKPVEIE